MNFKIISRRYERRADKVLSNYVYFFSLVVALRVVTLHPKFC